MVVVFECPITVQVDNFVVIFLSNNTYVYQAQKHTSPFILGLRLGLNSENYIFHSEKNPAHPFTKNLSNEPFHYLAVGCVYHLLS